MEYNEYHSSQSVRWHFYYEYFTAGYGLFGAISIFFVFIACQFLSTFTGYWLAYWSFRETRLCSSLSNQSYLSNQSITEMSLIENSEFQQERRFNLIVYSSDT